MTDPKELDCSDLPHEQVERILQWHTQAQQKLLSELINKSEHYTEDGLVAVGIDAWAVPVSVINKYREELG